MLNDIRLFGVYDTSIFLSYILGSTSTASSNDGQEVWGKGGWHFVICWMLRSHWGANECHHFLVINKSCLIDFFFLSLPLWASFCSLNAREQEGETGGAVEGQTGGNKGWSWEEGGISWMKEMDGEINRERIRDTRLEKKVHSGSYIAVDL